MLTFYTNPNSRARIIRWMLEEVGEPYDEVLVRFGEDMHSPKYLAINPMGKVPAIVHDGHVVTEAAAICTYLAQAFPQAGLMAKDIASFYRWMFFVAGPVEQAVTNKAMGWAPRNDREETSLGYGSLSRVMDTLVRHLSQNDYMVDGRFTAADVYIGSHVGFAMSYGLIPENPVFRTYVDRLSARPAGIAATAKDDALAAEIANG